MKSLNKKGAGMIIFYVFEAFAILLAFVGFILAIIQAVDYSSFMVFVQSWLTTLGTALIVFGIGKIIDLMYRNVKVEKDTSEDEKKEE